MRFQLLGFVSAWALFLAGCSSSGAESTTTKWGYVTVVSSETTYISTTFVNAVGAGFFDSPGPITAKGCMREFIGACEHKVCDLANGGGMALDDGPPRSAGTVSIGGTTPPFTLSYDPDTKWYNPAPEEPHDQLLFEGGSTITFAATGADVPGFTESLVAPSPLVVVSPSLSGTAVSVDTSKDLEFRWTGSSSGRLTFSVGTTTTDHDVDVASTLVRCKFDASAQRGTIPATMLRKLTKTDEATTGHIESQLDNVKNVVVGDYKIILTVGSDVYRMEQKVSYATGQITIL